jgi:phosphatidate cytidylyltransferase
MTADPRWSDLATRLATGGVIAALGLSGVVLGGVWFQMLAVFVTAVMIWELCVIIHPQGAQRAVLLAALTASVLSGMFTIVDPRGLALFVLIPLLGALVLPRGRWVFLVYALGIVMAGWGLVTFRETYGFVWILWLLAVIVATDMAGYFAGRAIGGRRFWPAISPSKTWAGIVAGWAAAAGVGAAFTAFSGAGWQVIWISVLVSFASQMGDIAESALKRRFQVKDSSAILPGHGGLFDRFDGVLGGALFMLAAAYVFDVPGVAF